MSANVLRYEQDCECRSPSTWGGIPDQLFGLPVLVFTTTPGGPVCAECHRPWRLAGETRSPVTPTGEEET